MKELKFISGQGYYDGNGECEVKFDANGIEKNKIFSNYEAAKKFYDTINSDKALWQRNPTELIELHSLCE